MCTTHSTTALRLVECVVQNSARSVGFCILNFEFRSFFVLQEADKGSFGGGTVVPPLSLQDSNMPGDRAQIPTTKSKKTLLRKEGSKNASVIFGRKCNSKFTEPKKTCLALQLDAWTAAATGCVDAQVFARFLQCGGSSALSTISKLTTDHQ